MLVKRFTIKNILTHQIRGRYYMTFFHLYTIISAEITKTL
jgi:hypothetical protein